MKHFHKRTVFFLVLIFVIFALIALFRHFVVSTPEAKRGLLATTSYNLPVNSPAAEQATFAVDEAPGKNNAERMIIRNAELTLEVNDIESASQQIQQIIEVQQGFIVYASIERRRTQQADYARMDLRVPAQLLDKTLEQIKQSATKVVTETVSGEDITEQYTDLETQLKYLQQVAKKLQSIMDAAEDSADVLKAYKELANVQARSERLQGKLKYYQQAMQMSALHINLHLSANKIKAEQTTWQLAQTWQEAKHGLQIGIKTFVESMIKGVVYYLPILLLWLIPIGLLAWVLLVLYKRMK
jgi:tetratricopeptide (TPR) repeat protein